MKEQTIGAPVDDNFITPQVSPEEKIAEMEAQIMELRAEVRRERKKKEAYDMGHDTGVQVSAIMQGLIDGGLREEHAWQLLIESLRGGILR